MPLVQKGLTLEDALLEAAAFAPVSRVMLHCYELWHPSMAEPIYLVRDYADFTCRIESDAPRNGGDDVLHTAAWFRFSRPTESDQSDSPRVALSIDNVAGLMTRALAAARGSRELWELTERVYASDQPNTLAVSPPLAVNLTDVEISGATCTAQALYADPVNVAVPTRLFTPEKYAGLVAR